MSISGVNNNSVTQLPQQIRDGETNADALVQSAEKLEAAAQELKPLLSELSNLNVGTTKRVEETKKARDLTEVPEVDDAEPGALDAIMNDLEALIALLQAEQDEKTIEATKKRIESLKGQLEANHANTMKKVNESIDKMKEQENASIFNKIFGWLGVVVAAVVAAAMCVTVGGSVAAVAVIGAAIGLATQIMNETGATEKITKALSEHLQKTYNMSKAKADAWAGGIVAGVQIALSVVMMVGGGFASAGEKAAKLALDTVKAIKIGMLVTNGVMAAGSTATSVASTVINYDAAKKQAEVTEMQAILLQLQTLLDQESDDLKELLEHLQNSFAAVLELLQSKQDTLNIISENLSV